ncbi:hypothetical protein T35B1_16916 [Salinisphaera shabanensis T35B1]
MDNERISNELQALMAHMASRGVTRQDGAYLFARSIGDMLGMFCDDDDDKALILASLVRVARIQAGLPEAH